MRRSVANNDLLSSKAYSIIRALVEKDPENRLGSNEMGGVDAIKKHPFFKGIDFELLEWKELKSPFKIKVKGKGDLQHINKDVQ